MKRNLNKRNKKYDKSTKKLISAGEYYIEKIFGFLVEHPGSTPHEIAENLGIERQTVQRHLKTLKIQNRVYSIGWKYYIAISSSLNHIYWFAKRMDRLSYAIAVPPLIEEGDSNYLHSSSSVYATPFEILKRKTTGRSPSNELCKTNFTNDNINEKYLFEFANRIGAYITFMFIESMRPSSPNVNKKNSYHIKQGQARMKVERNKQARDLIFNAVKLKNWYQYFCILFSKTNLTNYNEPRPPRLGEKPNPARNIDYYELDQKQFNNLSQVFRNVYPGIYEGMEECWSKIVEDTVNAQQFVSINIKCKHKWEEIKIYKYPKKCYYCRNCHNLSHSKSKIKPKNLPVELQTNSMGLFI